LSLAFRKPFLARYGFPCQLDHNLSHANFDLSHIRINKFAVGDRTFFFEPPDRSEVSEHTTDLRSCGVARSDEEMVNRVCAEHLLDHRLARAIAMSSQLCLGVLVEIQAIALAE
jgi:hypothetical protein